MVESIHCDDRVFVCLFVPHPLPVTWKRPYTHFKDEDKDDDYNDEDDDDMDEIHNHKDHNKDY